MKFYNMLQASRALNKSYPTVIRWYRDGRIIPDGMTPLGVPIFSQTTIDSILEELKHERTPEIKQKNSTGDLAMT